MTDAADPEVVPTLGLLAGQYTFRQKKADHYFRTLGRLLCDLEEGDLVDLKTLLRGVDACQGLGDLGNGNVTDVGVRTAQSESGEILQAQTSKETFHTMGSAPSARRLFFLLKREGFGRGVGGGFLRPWNTLQSNDSTIMMDFVTSRRMLATVDPSPGSP